ncbi:MAG: glycosyltransferase family 4 protein [Desulfobacula sp.]|nr:glycosyltransferase family 4 protein [Desulfobacula sp.]
MKICIVTASLNQGGASIIACDVAKGFAHRGHKVLLLCSSKRAESWEEDGYRVRALDIKMRNPFYHYVNPLLLYKLNNILAKFNPDLIHVHTINLQTFSLASLLFSRRYPMVWTIHDLWPLCMTGWPTPSDCNQISTQCTDCRTWPNPMVKANKLIKETIFRCSRVSVVCPNNWLANLLRESNLSCLPVYIVPNGIDPTIFSHITGIENESKNNFSDQKDVILFCGGLRLAGQLPAERKGWTYLVTALEILSRKRSDIHLLYVGDALDLPSQSPVPVTFVKEVVREKMKNYYSVADIFVLPTLADNSPLTILEAMACKVPIITTNVGGIAESITHDETGLLCPPRNATALAEFIEYLLLNPARGIEMAERAYQRFINEFTFERMIDEYETVYQQTISRVRSA